VTSRNLHGLRIVEVVSTETTPCASPNLKPIATKPTQAPAVRHAAKSMLKRYAPNRFDRLRNVLSRIAEHPIDRIEESWNLAADPICFQSQTRHASITNAYETGDVAPKGQWPVERWYLTRSG
jgi:hypothetical protein